MIAARPLPETDPAYWLTGSSYGLVSRLEVFQ